MTKIKICGLVRTEDIDFVNEALPDYAGFILHFPKSHRNVAVEEAKRLKNLLGFNVAIQDQVFNKKEEHFKGDDLSFIFDIHEGLDFINPEYAEIIKKAEGSTISSEYDDVFTRLAVYYIYRYYLNAVETKNVLSTIKRIFCAYIITGSIAASETEPDLIRIIQNYSKEVEHSYENAETLELLFESDERFSAFNLAGFI